MNVVHDFLAQNRARLDLDRLKVPDRLRAILITPRFRSSRHIVFLLLPDGSRDPVLVAKLPRLGGESPALSREAAALRAIQQVVAPGTAPELIALESHRGHLLLVETALPGPPLNPAAVRRDPASAVTAASEWLLDVHHRSAMASAENPTWFDRLVEWPLDRLAAALGPTAGSAWLIDRTRKLAAPLREAALPLVLAHGDFAHPNLVQMGGGRLGAVDWELSEMPGLPVCDFVLFLAYAAAARAGAQGVTAIAASYHGALYGSYPWLRPYRDRYCAAAGLEPAWFEPLAALAFARNLAERVESTTPTDPTQPGSVSELLADRRYALWKQAVLDADRD